MAVLYPQLLYLLVSIFGPSVQSALESPKRWQGIIEYVQKPKPATMVYKRLMDRCKHPRA